ncbi:MAG: exonuclease domain-containing protein [Mucinivorans sp.]
MLELKRPIIFFDLETTGVDPASDKIIEIGMIKVHPSGEKEVKTRRINPERHIPQASTVIHGIKDEDVKDEPTFAQIARSLYLWIEGCDLAGYNSNRFDVPMLVEEFLRAGVEIDLSQIKLVDVQNIFHKKEQRTLAAAHKFYCGSEIVNAHSAAADIEATYNVLLAQLDRYDDLQGDVDFLADYSKMGNFVDFAGRIVLDDQGTEVFNFGKYKGRAVVEVFRREPSYYDWMIKGDFTLNTKNVITRIWKG